MGRRTLEDYPARSEDLRVAGDVGGTHHKALRGTFAGHNGRCNRVKAHSFVDAAVEVGKGRYGS
jgi:hypothetical protein